MLCYTWQGDATTFTVVKDGNGMYLVDPGVQHLAISKERVAFESRAQGEGGSGELCASVGLDLLTR